MNRYAVDFDGTLFKGKYPGTDINYFNKPLLKWLIKKQKQGNIIILWTCRDGDLLMKSVETSAQLGLVFDYVNENTTDSIKTWGDHRKVCAEKYIDDRISLRWVVRLKWQKIWRLLVLKEK